jgi:hypothetical protein
MQAVRWRTYTIPACEQTLHFLPMWLWLASQALQSAPAPVHLHSRGACS